MFPLYKVIFFLTLFLGTTITVSSHSWLATWMGLEINLLSFIPLISESNNPYSSESSIKYFLVQALGSSILLISIIMIMMKNLNSNEMFYINSSIIFIMNSSILMKMGAAPFHFWFPEIIEGMSWLNSLILMTWQKIAPMIIMSYLIKNNMFIMMIILMSTLIGSIGGLNQTKLRKILTYSSINHIGWMLSALIINEYTWIMYFMVYSIISLSIILMFKSFNIFMLKQIFSMKNNNYMIKFFMMFNLLSLGGLPPFLGFLPKWLIIQHMSTYNMFITLFIIMMTLITLFFYLQIMYSSIMIYNNENNFYSINNKYNENNLLINYTTFISIFGLLIYTFFMNLF
uniref:NADH-ubiquinone oxidoreductase chain 2 n=1 Tax=Sternopriscus clavatus TaxID=521640 RepID=A0A894JWN1_9DYTI|nr:NADH dehydrogenase subunit 2 [Sternopriscus clavatus]